MGKKEKLPTHVTFYNRENKEQHLSYKIERDVLHHHPVYRCESKSIEIAYEDNQWEVRYVTRQHRTFWWDGVWVPVHAGSYVIYTCGCSSMDVYPPLEGWFRTTTLPLGPWCKDIYLELDYKDPEDDSMVDTFSEGHVPTYADTLGKSDSVTAE